MGRGTALAALVVLLIGAGLVALSISTGAARIYLLLFVIPVISGGSLEFLLGVGLVFAGLVGLMLGLSVPSTPETEEAALVVGPRGERPSAPDTATGGVVLIGPIPIFFGAARPAGRRYYLLALVLAAGLFAAVLALALWR